MTKEKLNCWEFMKCGRGPDGTNSQKAGVCPAALENRLAAVHGGRASGRACWLVAGTYCGGTVQGTFARKNIMCQRCDFYQKVHREEKENLENTHALLNRLRGPSTRLDISTKKLGVLLGGSGLIGGALTHHFKTHSSSDIEVLSPNSIKLSLRESRDIQQYFTKYQPDFIINCAIAPIDSDAQMAYEINYLGSIRLARMALALKIPYIHCSSAATLPMAENLPEEALLPLQRRMSNYAKSKLMAEKTLAHLQETQGLDYTIIRLGVVYGKHDHKIQGFQRLLFSIAGQSMPYILSRPGVFHSYTHVKKIPPFMEYILGHREEFSGQTYNFVDQEPVELVALIKFIKSQLRVKFPREIYVPYPLARTGKTFINWLIKKLGGFGVEIRMPAEIMFMKNFYQSQTLRTEKLAASSYADPMPEVTIYRELPAMIEYYLIRWRQLNRLSPHGQEGYDPRQPVGRFFTSPEELLNSVHESNFLSADEFDEKF